MTNNEEVFYELIPFNDGYEILTVQNNEVNNYIGEISKEKDFNIVKNKKRNNIYVAIGFDKDELISKADEICFEVQEQVDFEMHG